MIKSKPCKGTGKAKGYGCGKMTENRVYGLGKMCCYSDWLLNSEQGKIKLAKATLKATKPRKELEKAITREKQKKSLETLKKSVSIVCHKYIRERDKGKECISCGNKWNKNFQAGHFYKAELYSNLKYHEFNINGQCRICNLHKDGNFEGYRFGIVKRYGKEVLQELDQLAADYKKNGFKWDREELKKTRTKYNLKLKK